MNTNNRVHTGDYIHSNFLGIKVSSVYLTGEKWSNRKGTPQPLPKPADFARDITPGHRKEPKRGNVIRCSYRTDSFCKDANKTLIETDLTS